MAFVHLCFLTEGNSCAASTQRQCGNKCYDIEKTLELSEHLQTNLEAGAGNGQMRGYLRLRPSCCTARLQYVVSQDTIRRLIVVNDPEGVGHGGEPGL